MFDELKIFGYWYLATPYAKYPHGRALAFTHAAQVAGKLFASGIHIFCPITHGHPWSAHPELEAVEGSHDMWMPLDQHFMNHAHGIIVVKMPGWQVSKGVQMEIDYFTNAVKPVRYLSYPELELVAA